MKRIGSEIGAFQDLGQAVQRAAVHRVIVQAIVDEAEGWELFAYQIELEAQLVVSMSGSFPC